MNKRILYLTLAVIVLASCRKMDYYELVNPVPEIPLENPGQIIVTPPPTLPDNPDGTPGAPVTPDNTTVNIIAPDGTTYPILPGTAADVPSGSYQMVVVSGLPGKPSTTPGMVNVQGTSVSSIPTTEGELPSSSVLYGGISTVTVTGNKVNTVTPPLQPLTRQVSVTCKLNGLSTADFAQSEIRLTGVANSREVKAGATGKSAIGRAVAEGYFVRAIARTLNADGTFTVSFNLLGVDADKAQAVRVTINRVGGTSADFAQKVTEAFAGFNNFAADIKPLPLNFIINFGLGDINGSIEPWTPGVDEDIKG